jgi:choline dehydrogenase-like flavoprotein
MADPTPQTIFTCDVLGNYVCNTFAEAMASGPFDVIIIGGGTFGLTLAQDLFFRARTKGSGTIPDDARNKPPNYRILVLEGGLFTLPEHVQDLPNFGLANPGVQAPFPPGSALPATRQELITQGKDKKPIFEVWGLPWNSAERFGGLAYTLGGRSLYFGGWSPRYLDTQMPTMPVGSITAQTLWPQAVVDDLKARFFLVGAKQTGVSAANDFLNGKLQDFYRQQAFAKYAAIPNTVPLAELPDYVTEAPEDVTPALQAQLASAPPGFQDSLKLDAPLSVQSLSRAGFFPFNKFSSVPGTIAAARQAFGESGTNDAIKRLMIVPKCHVKSLRTRTYTVATGAVIQEIDGIDTGDGFIDLTAPIGGNVNRRPQIVLALGAIESARLALLAVGNGPNAVPNAGLMGRNFMVHLRKNVTFTANLPALGLTDQEVCALLVRCRATIAGTPVHFHLQITASALSAGSGAAKSDALLFQNVPDLDNLRLFSETAPGEVDVSIRGVGEMLPNQPNNVVTVPLNPPDNDEYTVPRANVGVVRSATDVQVMTLMDASINAAAQQIFGKTINAANVQPDGLGTTYHESGTLRMGDDPTRSVVNADGQFHYVTNLYAGDAAVLPTCGSANPVMNGVALRRRLAKRLVPEGDGIGPSTSGRPIRPFAKIKLPTVAPAPGTVLTLFDGRTLANWRLAGRGTFHVIDGALQSVPSFNLGLLWCTIPMPQNYRLELDFFQRTFQTNAGVFVRFRNPDATGYYNPAWSAVFIPGMPATPAGFEIQIDNTGAPDGRAKHKTGAVYAVNYPNDPPDDPALPPAVAGDFVNPQNARVLAWNQLQIDVRGDIITVNLNGIATAKYSNTDPNRGRFSTTEPTFIGLQSYSDYSFTTAFRNVRATVLP